MNDSAADGTGRGPTRRQQGGPPLVLLSLICLGLLFGGLAIGVALGGVMPLPYGPAAAVAGVRARPTGRGASHRHRGVRVVGAVGDLRGDGQCPVAAARGDRARSDDRADGRHPGGRRAGSDRFVGLDAVATRSQRGHRSGSGGLLPGVSGRRPGAHRGLGSAGRRYGGAQPHPGADAENGGLDRPGDCRPRRIGDVGVGLAGTGSDPADRTDLGVGMAGGGRRAIAAAAQRYSDARAIASGRRPEATAARGPRPGAGRRRARSAR